MCIDKVKPERRPVIMPGENKLLSQNSIIIETPIRAKNTLNTFILEIFSSLVRIKSMRRNKPLVYNKNAAIA